MINWSNFCVLRSLSWCLEIRLESGRRSLTKYDRRILMEISRAVLRELKIIASSMKTAHLFAFRQQSVINLGAQQLAAFEAHLKHKSEINESFHRDQSNVSRSSRRADENGRNQDKKFYRIFHYHSIKSEREPEKSSQSQIIGQTSSQKHSNK